MKKKRVTQLNTDDEILRVPLSASRGLHGQQLKIQATYSRVPISDTNGTQQGQGSVRYAGLAGLAGIGGVGGNGQHGNGSGIFNDRNRNPGSLPSTRGKYAHTYIHTHTHTHTHTLTHTHTHTHTYTHTHTHTPPPFNTFQPLHLFFHHSHDSVSHG